MSEHKSMAFSKELCNTFVPSKRFENPSHAAITSLDYDDSGQYLISTSADDNIHIYDTKRGKHLKAISSKKYGCHLARFTHMAGHCIHSSTNGENIIRYLDTSTESYVRYFKGHEALVTSLEVNPRQDLVVSGSLDGTVKMWDLRASNCQASIPTPGPSHLAMDPSGQVLCVSSTRSGTASFHIMKTMAQFDRTIQLPMGFKWNKVEFSNDNKYILFSSTNGNHVILDAFEFTQVAILGGIDAIPVPLDSYPYTGTASFSPDGRYVFSGSGQGNVAVWSLNKDDYPDHTLPKLPNPIQPLYYLYGDNRPKILAFNPKLMQFTTADIDLHMWIPQLNGDSSKHLLP